MPWSTQLNPTQGGQYVWQTEKETPFLVLQRFTPEQNLIGGFLMTMRKAFRPTDVPPYRVITKRAPNYSVAYGNTVSVRINPPPSQFLNLSIRCLFGGDIQEVDQYLQWIDMWLLPRLPSVRLPAHGSIEVFIADFLSNWARIRGESCLINLTEDDFRLVVGNRYPLNMPVQPLQDPILLALSKRQERTGQLPSVMSFSKIEESSMSGPELDSYRSYQSCLGPAGAPAALIPLHSSAPLMPQHPPPGMSQSRVDTIPQYHGGPYNRPGNGPPLISSQPGRPPSAAYPGNAPSYPGNHSNRASYPPRQGPPLPANSPAFVQSGVPNVSMYAAPPAQQSSDSPIQNDWIDLLDDEGKPGAKESHSAIDVNIAAPPVFPAVSNPSNTGIEQQLGNLSLQPSAPGASPATSSKKASSDADDDDEDKNTCKICFEREINTVLLNCAHSVVCDLCGQNPKLKNCPICRQPIKQVLKIYKC